MNFTARRRDANEVSVRILRPVRNAVGAGAGYGRTHGLDVLVNELGLSELRAAWEENAKEAIRILSID